MGATTVICTDKTGTLTQNRMTVAEAAFPSLPEGQLTASEESQLIAEGIAVNSTATLDLSDAARPSVRVTPLKVHSSFGSMRKPKTIVRCARDLRRCSNFLSRQSVNIWLPSWNRAYCPAAVCSM